MINVEEMRGEGVYAVKLIVPNVDRHEAAKELAAYNQFIDETTRHDAWNKKRNKDNYWNMSTEDRAVWNVENPEPETHPYDSHAALERVMNLLTWIAADPKEGPSIFTKKPAKAADDDE